MGRGPDGFTGYAIGRMAGGDAPLQRERSAAIARATKPRQRAAAPHYCPCLKQKRASIAVSAVAAPLAHRQARGVEALAPRPDRRHPEVNPKVDRNPLPRSRIGAFSTQSTVDEVSPWVHRALQVDTNAHANPTRPVLPHLPPGSSARRRSTIAPSRCVGGEKTGRVGEVVFAVSGQSSGSISAWASSMKSFRRPVYVASVLPKRASSVSFDAASARSRGRERRAKPPPRPCGR